MKEVTICIPTFNQARYLPGAIQSALDQKGCRVSVVVSDDASTDDTEAVMAAYATELRVRYCRHEENRGVAANAGWALQQAASGYVVRLDSDDELRESYCAELIECLESHPEAAVAHCGIEEIDESGAIMRLRLLSRRSGYQGPEEALRDAIKGYKVAANICMFRRSALPEAPVYPKAVNFCEDWALFAILAANGWGNVYNGNVLARYRVWRDTGKTQGRRLVEIVGTRRIFDDILKVAFERRKWETRVLEKARKRRAVSQVLSMPVEALTEEMVQEIDRLSNAVAVKLAVRARELNLAPVFRLYERLRLAALDLAKLVWHRMGHASAKKGLAKKL